MEYLDTTLEQTKSEAADSLSLYFNEIGDYPVLSKEEETVLGKKAMDGDLEARNKLITHNLKYVVAVAKKYRDKGVPFEDLICAGNLALFFAAEEFDPDKGRFASYSSYWITKAMVNLFKDKGGVIQDDEARESDRFEQYKRELAERMGNTYGIAASEITPFAILDYIDSIERLADENIEIIDQRPDPERKALDEDLKDRIRDLLSELGEKERECLKLYYGLDGEDPRDIREIARTFGLTPGRVQRVLIDVRNKLRISEKARELRSFMGE